MISSKLLTPVLGSAFILGGLLNFLPVPDLAPDDMGLYTAHNLLHIVTGIALLIGGHLGHRRNTILGTGLAFVAITIVGSLTSGDLFPGVIHVNAADRWFHAMLAFVLLVVGMAATRDGTNGSSKGLQPTGPFIEHARPSVPHRRAPPHPLPSESLKA